MPEPQRILVLGAHPDDTFIKVGGLGIKWVRQGYAVKFVSATNGATGHHEIGGGPMARREYQEVVAAARVGGMEYEVLDIPTGQLVPTLDYRWWLVKIIRSYQPDLVITHRPNDYHPDHRYLAQLVHDAAYTVTLPNVVPLTPHLRANPIFAYMSDTFRKPYPFAADVVVGIDDVLERKLDMLHCFESQFYEWLPYNKGILEQVPAGETERRAWLAQWRAPDWAAEADRSRDLLRKLYGEERAAMVLHAESLEISEYGAALTAEKSSLLFPFFGEKEVR